MSRSNDFPTSRWVDAGRVPGEYLEVGDPGDSCIMRTLAQGGTLAGFTTWTGCPI